MDFEGGDHETADQYGCWSEVSLWRRLSLRPIGCTPALSVKWTAPLQLRYAACDAIHVLYAFACAYAFAFSEFTEI